MISITYFPSNFSLVSWLSDRSIYYSMRPMAVNILSQKKEMYNSPFYFHHQRPIFGEIISLKKVMNFCFQIYSVPFLVQTGVVSTMMLLPV